MTRDPASAEKSPDRHTAPSPVRYTSWGVALRAYGQPKMMMMLVLGFSAGLPFLLYFSTLSIRLETSGIDIAIIAYFSWFGLVYALKFLWAPLIDRLTPPGLGQLFGKRRGWIFVAQIGIALGLIGLGASDPQGNLVMTAAFAFLTAFASATQDIAIDAWRIEAASHAEEQAPLAATYQYGYRVGMLVAGGLALVIAGAVNWTIAYWAMAGFILFAGFVLVLWREGSERQSPLISLAGILVLAGICYWVASMAGAGLYAPLAALISIPLIFRIKNLKDLTPNAGLKGLTRHLSGLGAGIVFALGFFGCFLLGVFLIGYSIPRFFDLLGVTISRSQINFLAVALAAAPFIIATALIPVIRRLPASHRWMRAPATAPVLDFFWRHGWSAAVILAFISCYRLSDIVMGVMAKVSYSHIGYSPQDIGIASGTYGPVITFIGVALAGVFILRFGMTRSLVLGAIVSVIGNLTFVWLMGQSALSLWPIMLAITADNIAGGFAGTVFVAYLSNLTNRNFTAAQYALFSSVFLLVPKLAAGTSGAIVEATGFAMFFTIAAAMGLPAIILSLIVTRLTPDRPAYPDRPSYPDHEERC